MNQIRFRQGDRQGANVEARDAAFTVFLVLPRENLTQDPCILSVLGETVACCLRQNRQRTTGAFQAECVACDEATNLLTAAMGATGRSWLVRRFNFAQKTTTTMLVWQPEGSAHWRSCVLPPDGCLAPKGPVVSAFVSVLSSDHCQLPLSFHILNTIAAYWYQKHPGLWPAAFGIDNLTVLPQGEQFLLAASGAHGQGWTARVHQGEQTVDVLVWVRDMAVPATPQAYLAEHGGYTSADRAS